MPGSNPIFKPEIKNLIARLYPDKDASVLDVGAGQGTYSDLLRGLVARIDAIEVHTPYIDDFKLLEKYDVVFPMNVKDFNFYERFYDVIVFGDIVEHLTHLDAVQALKAANENCTLLIVVVPFNTPQGAVNGVAWETHLQPDLTVHTMRLRYSMLRLWLTDNKIAVYLGSQ